MKIEYPKDAKSLTEMLASSNKEVTHLSDIVSRQADQIQHMGMTINKWEARFDRLLEIRR